MKQYSPQSQWQTVSIVPSGGLFWDSEQTHVCALIHLEPGMKMMANPAWVSLCILLADDRCNYMLWDMTLPEA